jgi:hypothetical protein
MGAGMLNIKNAPPFEDGVTAKQAEDSKRASPGIQGGDFIQADLGGSKEYTTGWKASGKFRPKGNQMAKNEWQRFDVLP